MMGGGGGVVPPALLDESRVPRFYRDAIAACGATQAHMLPHTALVYNLMVTSGLPRPVLSYIWSAVNRTLPGQLTRPEFFSCLALIALAQLPPAQPLSAPVVNIAKPPAAPPAKEQRHSSLFIPTSLLLGRRNSKKKEVDLLGEAIPPPPKPSPQSAPITPEGSAAPQRSAVALIGHLWHHLNRLFHMNWVHRPLIRRKAKRMHRQQVTFQWVVQQRQKSTGPRTFLQLSLQTSITSHVKTADNLLGSATEEVLKEVAQTERGDGYLRCLNRLYFVVCRVERSAGVDLPQRYLDDIAKCGKVWKRLSNFVEGTPEEDECSDKGDKKCAICYQPVSNPVYFGGQTYHSECANLWVNDFLRTGGKGL
ncbi:hypothetical protein ANCDUO_04791 [Ancylostoma duodenale]|uniref:EH domain-containing protein n=1 Tax=Ancylostoma duodenale TaxID=51022 RepID=A0A0C2H078_9BILA|nr:hypothetical protein ANCDUO_04791 [Ancylostoma duodenale]